MIDIYIYVYISACGKTDLAFYNYAKYFLVSPVFFPLISQPPPRKRIEWLFSFIGGFYSAKTSQGKLRIFPQLSADEYDVLTTLSQKRFFLLTITYIFFGVSRVGDCEHKILTSTVLTYKNEYNYAIFRVYTPRSIESDADKGEGCDER